MSSALELVADARCEIAEGPLWHPDEECLYWTDIPAGMVYRLDPADGIFRVEHEGALVGGMTLQQDGSLLFLGAGGSISVWRSGHITRTIVSEIPEERATRFNDAIADPVGRVFSGTMAQKDVHGKIVHHGRFYCIEPDGRIRTLFGGMGSPNGMGFTADHRRLYLTDSIPGIQAIFSFDYDVDSGTLENRKLFHQTPLEGSDGRPDGMVMDVEDCVWSARWDGGAIVRLGPDGVERERHEIPVRKVTSLTFGGADYTDLYITTARTPDLQQEEPGAGGIFRLRTGTAGRKEFRSSVRW